jgi:hypothetical protein
MANTIRIKRPSAYDSSTDPSGLVYGELAWANGNNKFFIGKQTDSGGAVVAYHLPTLRDLTAGNGLDVTSPSNGSGAVTLSLDLKSSGGLKIDSTEVAVEPADIAGSGLEDDGSDNLRIAAAAAGTGLSGGAGSALSVDYGSSAGNAAQGNTTISLSGVANEIAITGTTAQALGGGPSYTIGMPDDVTIGGVLTVTGNLVVNGTTTTVNSTTVTIDDPIFTLGGDSTPSSDDNKDRGIEYKWHNGSAAKLGFFGMDDSDSKFKFIPDSSVSSEAYSGSVGSSEWNDLEASSLTGATLSSCTIDAGTY